MALLFGNCGSIAAERDQELITGGKGCKSDKIFCINSMIEMFLLFMGFCNYLFDLNFPQTVIISQ